MKKKLLQLLKNKRFIICGIIVVFLVLLIIFLEHNNFTQPHTASSINYRTLPKEASIYLTNQGFNPRKITVTKGMAVRWINKSTQTNASVNSDNYPDNRLYPELNLGVFRPGSTLVHIFASSGTYTYHNQYNPEQTGTVIVK